MRLAPERLRSNMPWIYVVSGVTAAVLLVYLTVALLKPEIFS